MSKLSIKLMDGNGSGDRVDLEIPILSPAPSLSRDNRSCKISAKYVSMQLWDTGGCCAVANLVGGLQKGNIFDKKVNIFNHWICWDFF